MWIGRIGDAVSVTGLKMKQVAELSLRLKTVYFILYCHLKESYY